MGRTRVLTRALTRALLLALALAGSLTTLAAGSGDDSAKRSAPGSADSSTEPSAEHSGESAGSDYARHCAACHGADRLGGMGPALLPGNLRRLRKASAAKVIAAGRAATQMPAFGDRLDAARIDGLVGYIFTPPESEPEWGVAEIEGSQVLHDGQGERAKGSSQRAARASAGGLAPETVRGLPQDVDPLNLFVVVELGDHHVTVLDGDRLEPVHRFGTRFALHGGPKFSPDGRFVYFGSRDGWVSKYDLHALRYVAEVRAGINMRNIAVSHDGRFVLAANYLPHSLVLLDARRLDLIKVIPVRGADGQSSRVSAVYAAPPRSSFVVALKDIPEVWELGYSAAPQTGLSGWSYDYPASDGHASVLASAQATAQASPSVSAALRFPIRKLPLEGILDDFFFDPEFKTVVGAARDGGGQAVDLDTGLKVGDLALDGLPHLGSGITWPRGDTTVLATPHLKTGAVSVIDMGTWETIKTIETLGPGFFMRSHEGTPYAWVDVFFGPHRDAVHVIDKRSLEIVKTLRPAPGKTAAHVEFNRDGSRALLSVWDPDGAVVVYDSSTLTEVKRLPMRKPSGKYNVWNKITRSRGTSR